MQYDQGTYQIKCVKPGGCTLSAYGQRAFAENEVLDLLDGATPDTIRANDFSTARTMCEDTGFELAQRIEAGEFQIVERRMPNIDLTE